MDPSRLRDSSLTLTPFQYISDELFAELASAVKGPAFRPTDAEYTERSRTFNGKLRSLSRVLVSPLDARDVSAAVKFCVKHSLSPSVRAGGYAIAGWSVAGDVIIDMSMMADIDIERPKHSTGGEDGASNDWTPLMNMPPQGCKGKGHSATLASSLDGARRTDSSGAQRSGKRQRGDCFPEEMGSPSETKRGSLVDAAQTAASSLGGLPILQEAGELPIQRPTHRQRLDLPERTPFVTDTDPPPAPALGSQQHPMDTRLEMPVFNGSTRQLSGESTSSDSSSRQSVPFGWGSRSSQSSFDTAISSPDDYSKSDTTGNRESSTYVSSTWAATPSHRPAYGTSNPLGYNSASSSTAPTPTPPSAFPSMQNWSALSLPWTPQGPSTFPGVNAWNPAMGLGSGMASSSLPAPGMPGAPSMTSTMSGAHLSPLLGSFGIPPSLRAGAGSDARATPLGTIEQFRPLHPHAYVTFGAGMRQKDIDIYTAENPLEGTNAVTGERKDSVVPYHVPMAAHPVGSAIMLLAGFGFISRMYGLSIDNLVEVEMVLADGRIVVANAQSDPELWWAIRGAGPAFGIATRYKARGFPVSVVFAGNLIYPFHRATAPSLIKHFRDCIKNAPRELYVNVLLTAGPADKDSLIVIQMCYVGPRSRGLEYLQAISSWQGERCLLNEVNEKSFLRQQDSIPQVLRGRAGQQWFLRSALITTLPDEVINRTVLEFAGAPLGCTWLFELAGGAIGDFEDTCLPKEQREATWTVAALHQCDMGISNPRWNTTAEQWMESTLKQVSVGGPYPTFLGRHEPPARTMACYGKNWDRLAALKRKYDPQCLFKNNFWPLDAHGRPIEYLSNEPPSP